jgi:hypothetical protein
MTVVRVAPDAVEINNAFPSLPLPRLANFNADFGNDVIAIAI